ncbi:hypothetical protein ACH5RR_035592 [Cinchona calisaya]|uniref:DUF7792 domain-containing protein n=1 Tax=Cinchona calisaya TaxID=153742 RepID=A0ABD2Y1V2_9GENT
MARKMTRPAPTTAASAISMEEKEQNIEEVLSYPILLTERIRVSLREVDSFKSECCSVTNLAEDICEILRFIARIASSTSSGSLYERPIRRMVAEVARLLGKTLTLVRKCRRGSLIRRVMTIVSSADFKKLQTLLENSKADMDWLKNIFEGGGGITLSLPPFASNDPIIGWVWGPIASLYMGQISDKAEAANQLASLAKDNDRNKKYIVEEGGIPPLLKLLKENSSIDVQIAAATALFHLANDEERVCVIIAELGVPIIVQVLGDSPMKVQIKLANLVARMAEHSPMAREDFARENVIKPLVTLLSIDTFTDEPGFNAGKQSFHAIVEINKERERNQSHRPGLGSSLSMQSSNGSSRVGHHKKERENEPPEVKLRLKTSCAEALSMLARGSLSNSRRMTETKGLLCLAKLVGKEQGELLLNSLMTIMEITSAAESNADFRRAAFKTNSQAAKAVVDQLLRIIKEYENPTLQIPAIRAIGSLARTFPARETRVIVPLVEQLGHRNEDVATEAAIALGKFASPENFLHLEHSKSIIDFKGVLPLLRLFKGNERARSHGLLLLCYLVLHVKNSDALQQSWVLTTLDGAIPQHPELRELITDAKRHLGVYHSGLLHSRNLDVYHSGVLHSRRSYDFNSPFFE